METARVSREQGTDQFHLLSQKSPIVSETNAVQKAGVSVYYVLAHNFYCTFLSTDLLRIHQQAIALFRASHTWYNLYSRSLMEVVKYVLKQSHSALFRNVSL